MKHYFIPVHPYLCSLKSLLKEVGADIVDSQRDASVLWVPFKKSYADSVFYQPHLKLVYVWHGGDSHRLSEHSLRSGHYQDHLSTLNVVVKRAGEKATCKAYFPEMNVLHMLGKYTEETTIFAGLRARRKSQTKFQIPFAVLHHNFNNHAWGFEQYKFLPERKRDLVHCYGSNAPKGNRQDIEVLPLTKFSLFLKEGGYICNFVYRSILCGVPVVMLRELFFREYADIFPADIFILCETFEQGIDNALAISDDEYVMLSEKVAAYAELFLSTYAKDETLRTRHFLSVIEHQPYRTRALFLDEAMIIGNEVGSYG